MALARDPALVNIGEVVRDCEDNMDIVECFNGERRSCPLLPGCTLKSVLSDARENFLATLDAYTLAQMLQRKEKSAVDISRTIRVSGSRAGGRA